MECWGLHPLLLRPAWRDGHGRAALADESVVLPDIHARGLALIADVASGVSLKSRLSLEEMTTASW